MNEKTSQPFFKIRIFAVVVLYNVRVESCATFRDLMHAATRCSAEDLELSVLLYDNSPEPHSPKALPLGVTYIHAAQNGGVAAAYNYALVMALRQEHRWLLTLDQDTCIPEDFLSTLIPVVAQLSSSRKIAAIVPQVFMGERMISPYVFVGGAWPRFLPAGFIGTPTRPVFAINSGSLLRVATLQGLGGYDPRFWLDSSDHVLYARLSKRGATVYILGSLRLHHSLSHLDQQTPLSADRLQNNLRDESAFWDSEMPRFAGLAYTLVMARHLLGMCRRRESLELRRLVRRSLLTRLLRSRQYRLSQWRTASSQSNSSASKQKGGTLPS